MKKSAMTIVITLLLILTITIPIFNLPIVNAQASKKTFAYLGATPNPVGVGQETLLHYGITDAAGTVASDGGWKDLTITVRHPDNTTETLGPLNTDTTGGSGTVYIPTKTGTYYLQTHFPEQAAPWSQYGMPAGTIYKASDSPLLELIVTEEPIKFISDTPLPTEYWTRPIDSQHRNWYSVAGVWLERYPPHRFSANNDAPETPHVLWSKQLAYGGLAGGELGPMISYEQGDAYVGKWINSVIINGAVYYNRYEARGQPYTAQEVVAVDLKTGEELWCKPLIGTTGTTTGATVAASSRLPEGQSEQFPNGVPRRLEFGQLFYWDSYNMHGAYPLLWTTSSSTWMSFDALTGRWIYTITNVPSGTTLRGPKGEIYRLQVNLGQRWMSLWNMSAVVSMGGSWDPHGNVYNATGTGATPARAWVYNVTLPDGLRGSVKIITEEVIIGGTGLAHSLQPATRVLWGISSKPEDAGRLLFNTTWTGPEDVMCDIRPGYNAISLEDRVFVISAKEVRQYYGFSIDTGKQLWGPTEPPEPYFQSYSMLLTDAWPVLHMAYGKVFTAGQGGEVNAWDAKTGKRVWTYTATDYYTEMLFGNSWPIVVAFISDGKIYLEHIEHSPINPRPRGSPFICLDAETGEEIFRVDGLLRASWNGGNSIIGDSTIATFNTNDNTVYALGKGPSATTITASPEVSIHGNSVLIKGTVNDISPGTKDSIVAMRFPAGVPAVSDDSQGQWMKYVYTQFSRPTNTTGVDVILSVFDPNGNAYDIGAVKSDSSGTFGFTWKPEVPGQYTVVATFAGSKSYWPSFAQTYVTVDEALEATPTSTVAPQSVADMYFVPAIAGIIVAIITGFAVLALLLLRKRP